jgi:hypothetical protein
MKTNFSSFSFQNEPKKTVLEETEETAALLLFHLFQLILGAPDQMSEPGDPEAAAVALQLLQLVHLFHLLILLKMFQLFKQKKQPQMPGLVVLRKKVFSRTLTKRLIAIVRTFLESSRCQKKNISLEL